MKRIDRIVLHECSIAVEYKGTYTSGWKDPDTPIFFLEMGYVVIAVMILFGQSTFFGVMEVFTVIMMAAVLAQWILVGVMTWKVTARTP